MAWADARSRGMRVLRASRAARAGAVVVLTYHRIEDTALDPLGLATPPSLFEEHVSALAARYELMSAGQLFRLMWEGAALPRRGVVVTLDDGYADALTAALPILRAHRAPATVFACSGLLDGAREHWWDELERVILGGEGPVPPVNIEAPGAPAFLRPHSTGRADLHRDLSTYVEPLTAAAREGALAALRTTFEATAEVRPEKRALMADELPKLESGGLVEIGAHTVSHAHLASLSEEDQRVEIETSKRDLEEACGHKLLSFSYPYGTAGSFTPTTKRLVQGAGFLGAVTTEPGAGIPWGAVSRGSDPFAVPRMATRGLTADELIGAIDRRLGL